MRQLLAGLHPGSVHPGESQIDIKLYPEPPKKMPTGLNNEHLTRKPFDYHHPGRNSLVFFGTHFAYIFASSRVRGWKERHYILRTCYVIDLSRELLHILPPRILSHWENGCASNNYNVNYERGYGKNKANFFELLLRLMEFENAFSSQYFLLNLIPCTLLTTDKNNN